MDRLACVDVAALPLQLLLRAHPDWTGAPVAVVEADRPQALVLFANRQAEVGGVRRGQRYAAALTLVPQLRAGVISPSEIARFVGMATARLRRHSPHIEPAPDDAGVFWLDASGLGRLYASLQAWAAGVVADFARARITAALAVGFTRIGTYALAKSRRGTIVCASAAEERALVARVAIDVLDLDPAMSNRLRALGVHTVGRFLRLPATGIRSRLGSAAAAFHQLASGSRPAPLAPAPASEVYARSVDFDAPESNLERVIFIVKRLIDALIAPLATAGHAVAALSLAIRLDDRTTRTERVQPASPTIDAGELVTLVRLRLDACRFSAGLVALRITADVVPAAPEARRLFPLEGRRDADAANRAFARLRAEFGHDVVVLAELGSGHLPSAQFTWTPLLAVPARSAPRVVAVRPLVRRMYTRPMAITLADRPALIGPYTIAGGWWAGGVHRDYYFVRTADDECWWCYYDRRRRQFFLQGGVE